MKQLSPEEHILASINLYLDIVNLFLHILRLLDSMKKHWKLQHHCKLLGCKRIINVKIPVCPWWTIFMDSCATCFLFHSRYFTCHRRKAQVLLILVLFYLNVPVDTELSQHAQYEDPKTQEARWSSAISNLIYLYLCFPYCDITKCLPWQRPISVFHLTSFLDDCAFVIC